MIISVPIAGALINSARLYCSEFTSYRIPLFPILLNLNEDDDIVLTETLPVGQLLCQAQSAFDHYDVIQLKQTQFITDFLKVIL